MSQRKFYSLLIVSTILAFWGYACQVRQPSPNNTSLNSNSRVIAPAGPADPGSVRFKIQELARQQSSGGEEVTWLATHESASGVTRFQIRLILKKLGGDAPFVFSHGSFIRENNPQPSDFLQQVAKVLEAKHPKPKSSKADRLDFDAAIIGDNLSLGAEGGLSAEPPGDWMAVKVFVAEGEGEFFLNLNSKGGLAEISLKDPDYGDIVLRELWRVIGP